MPRAKTQANGGGRKLNKSEWIRSQPASLSAKEVVAKAKAEGIALSTAQVYTTRSNANRKPNGRARSGTQRRVVPSGDNAAAFRRFVLTLGLDRVEAMLSDLKRNAGL